MMLSVIIITKNAELTLEQTLKSVSFADEIIIVDSNSTDKTLDIAAKFTKKVFRHDDWQGYGVQKNRALSYAKGDWVLNLDADEYVDDKLKDEIIKAIKINVAGGYKIPIRMTFYNKKLKFSSSPTRHIRLFKREQAKYSLDIVHEKILLPNDVVVKSLKYPIWHNSFRDLYHAVYKINRYSSYSAKVRLNELKKPPGIFRSYGSSMWMFFRSYILQGGFLDGKEGLLFACLNAQGSFYRHLKQIYPDKNLDKLPTIETN